MMVNLMAFNIKLKMEKCLILIILMVIFEKNIFIVGMDQG